MKTINRIPYNDEIPFTAVISKYDDITANKLLGAVINNAKVIFKAVLEANKEEWSKNPSMSVRAVLGQWLITAARHFEAAIILCAENDLYIVADVHLRQIFELYLQVRYFVSLNDVEMEKAVDRIYVIGCVEYIEKLKPLKDHEYIKDGYRNMCEKVSHFDKALVDIIYEERKKSKNWFGMTFSKLAQTFNRPGEDLLGIYQITSTDVHGSWDLPLGVQNPEPGILDFRGYKDKTTMYVQAAERLFTTTGYYMNLWNEIAKTVGAEEVYYGQKTYYG